MYSAYAPLLNSRSSHRFCRSALAEEALLARGGIRGHHALANRKLRDTLAHGDDIAGQFVPEHSRGHDHAGVISAAEDFDVGAAGQRYFHPYEDVSAIDCGNGYRLHLQVFLAVKHGSHHVVIHL